MSASLNPYSNGICSMREMIKTFGAYILGLNPYSNGICSMRNIFKSVVTNFAAVLILILMEYAL